MSWLPSVLVVGATHDASNTPAVAGFDPTTAASSASARLRSHRRSNMCVISLEEDHRVPGGGRHPSFGSPAIRLADLTRGFASPSHDEFALIEKGSSLCRKVSAQEVPEQFYKRETTAKCLRIVESRTLSLGVPKI